MSLNIHELKVDQTALPIREHFILVSNINIPETYLHQEFDAVLERVQQFIVEDYINTNSVQFQVCATYDLRHSHSGQTKTWTGSFNPRGNQTNALNQFQLFTPEFIASVKVACSDENIYEKLRIFYVDTNWVFDRLLSIYITVQAVVSIHHPTIIKRSLGSIKNGKTRRAKTTFYLP